MLNDLGRKRNRLWVDQGSKLYNNSYNKWLNDTDIKMYSTHNEGKPFTAERCIGTLKHKTNKHMATVSKKRLF